MLRIILEWKTSVMAKIFEDGRKKRSGKKAMVSFLTGSSLLCYFWLYFALLELFLNWFLLFCLAILFNKANEIGLVSLFNVFIHFFVFVFYFFSFLFKCFQICWVQFSSLNFFIVFLSLFMLLCFVHSMCMFISNYSNCFVFLL